MSSSGDEKKQPRKRRTKAQMLADAAAAKSEAITSEAKSEAKSEAITSEAITSEAAEKTATSTVKIAAKSAVKSAAAAKSAVKSAAAATSAAKSEAISETANTKVHNPALRYPNVSLKEAAKYMTPEELRSTTESLAAALLAQEAATKQGENILCHTPDPDPEDREFEPRNEEERLIQKRYITITERLMTVCIPDGYVFPTSSEEFGTWFCRTSANYFEQLKNIEPYGASLTRKDMDKYMNQLSIFNDLYNFVDRHLFVLKIAVVATSNEGAIYVLEGLISKCMHLLIQIDEMNERFIMEGIRFNENESKIVEKTKNTLKQFHKKMVE